MSLHFFEKGGKISQSAKTECGQHWNIAIAPIPSPDAATDLNIEQGDWFTASYRFERAIIFYFLTVLVNCLWPDWTTSFSFYCLWYLLWQLWQLNVHFVCYYLLVKNNNTKSSKHQIATNKTKRKKLDSIF